MVNQKNKYSLHTERFCVNCNKVRNFIFDGREHHSRCSTCKGFKATKVREYKFDTYILNRSSTKSLRKLAGSISKVLAVRKNKRIK